MAKYIFRRILQLPVTLLFVTLLAFLMIRMLPGDPALAWLGESMAADEEAYQYARQELGLDAPLPVQYFSWLGRILQGDMGMSSRIRLPVTEIVLERIPVTLQLTLMGMAWAVAIGISVAVLGALLPGSIWDTLGTTGAIAGMAIPDFWLGILLIYLFGVALRLLPPSGYIPLADDPGMNLKLMLMPSFTLGVVQAAAISRQTRAAMAEVMGTDYIVTARAKGLARPRVVLRHGLRNAMLPVVTVIGLLTGRIVGSAVIVETVFAMPGLGRWAVDGILFRDYSAVQGVILLFALWVVVINLATDVLYAYLDPRIRYD